MNKRFAFIGIAVLIILFAGLLVTGGEQESETQSQSQDSGSNSTSTATTQLGGGTYEEYSEAALSRADGTRVLFFHASWCPQCRALDADIKKKGVPAGVTIFKVDYDKAQDLRKKYGVTLQTTVVKVDEQGNLVSKFTPYEKPTIDNALSNL